MANHIQENKTELYIENLFESFDFLWNFSFLLKNSYIETPTATRYAEVVSKLQFLLGIHKYAQTPKIHKKTNIPLVQPGRAFIWRTFKYLLGW